MRVLAHLLALLAAASLARAELTLLEQWPQGENVCLDTPLRLVFDGTPVIGGAGAIQVCRASDGRVIEVIEPGSVATGRFGTGAPSLLRYEPVRIEGNTVHLRLHPGALAAGGAYLVRYTPGLFTDAQGHPFGGAGEGWTFRTRPASAGDPDRFTVAADGTGDFCTIQGAIDRIAQHCGRPVTIYVRKGEYHELVRIGREKPPIHLVGEDRHATRLTAFNNEKLNPGAIQRAVLGVESDDFQLENLTVQNSSPNQGSQAEAVFIDAERCTLRQVDFFSFRNTLHLSGRIYIADCYLEGDLDYISGSGAACFERCELHSVHDGCLVQPHDPPTRLGYLFRDCRLTAAPGVEKCWLARIDSARFPASQVAFLHCAMGPHILPAGWQLTGPSAETIRFDESGSTDLQGQPLTASARASPSRQLPPREAAKLTPSHFLAGPDGWDPESAPRP